MGERYSQLVHFPRKAQLLLLFTLSVILLGVISLSLKREYTPTDTIGRVANATETSKEEPAREPVESKVDTVTTQVAVESSTNNQTKITVDSQYVTPDSRQDTEQSKPEVQTISTSEPKDFTFTAQPGDSYTKMARDAIKQYGATNKVTLQTDQIEKAAARLAYNAGSPYLEINQSVSIASTDIAALVGVTPQIATAVSTEIPNATNQTTPNTSYTYTAVSGDSYSVLARKTIKDNAKTNNISLTKAQSIAAETYLISDAGFPAVEIGQTVTFTTETVKHALDKALALSPAQLALWQPYADSVVI